MSWMNNQYRPGRGDKLYNPRHPDKYLGDVSKIITRSSYEMKFCQWLDNNPNVLEWSSENVEIPYFDPTSMKKRRYFPDYYMKVKNKDGKIKKFIIEVKPYKETIPPKKHKAKKKAAIIKENKTWTLNTAKWKAAEGWCKKWGFEFKLVTEKQLFGR